MNLTNQIIDNYYQVLDNVKLELLERIKEIVKEDIKIYDTSEGVDNKYYELPSFQWTDKHNYRSIYSITDVTKDFEVIGNDWETGDDFVLQLNELTIDTLYDLYIELSKEN